MSTEEDVPATSSISRHVIPTERAGAKNVWVQGDLSLAQKGDGQVCFMTVHDVGVNHTSWLDFVNHPSMRTIRERAVFLRVVARVVHLCLLSKWRDELSHLAVFATKRKERGERRADANFPSFHLSDTEDGRRRGDAPISLLRGNMKWESSRRSRRLPPSRVSSHMSQKQGQCCYFPWTGGEMRWEWQI